MYQNCEKVIRFTIPALRVAVSRELKDRYGMSESDIARNLGVAQAAVSKYLNGIYSKGTGKLVDFIVLKHMHYGIVKSIVNGSEPRETARAIDRTASEKALVNAALAHSKSSSG